jgi:hypothetical protein
MSTYGFNVGIIDAYTARMNETCEDVTINLRGGVYDEM